MSVCVIKNILNLDTIQHLFILQEVVKVVNVESGLFCKVPSAEDFSPSLNQADPKILFAVHLISEDTSVSGVGTVSEPARVKLLTLSLSSYLGSTGPLRPLKLS